MVAVPGHPIPEITVVSLNPENSLAQYLQGAFLWHLDGTMDATACAGDGVGFESQGFDAIADVLGPAPAWR